MTPFDHQPKTPMTTSQWHLMMTPHGGRRCHRLVVIGVMTV